METLFSPLANNEFFQNTMTMWWAYVPLGIVGAWRWSVWCFKKVISRFYRVPPGRYDATLSVVTPVYNEDPEMFRRALESWRDNDPLEIIAVIDHTDTACIEVFESFMRGFSGAKMIITHTSGKREALAAGIDASSGEIIALTDSDTLWTEGLKEKVIGPFHDPRVGGVAPRQDVLKADTFARRLFRIHIFNRYENDLAYQAAFGNALSCISGRTGVYRRSAIAHLTDELVYERFWGRKCISGDDKRLTSLVQRDGWDVKYMRDALVHTPGSTDMKTYTYQQVRWIRNSWRSDIQSLFTRWLWRNPFLAFHTIDRFIQPFTLLLGPMFFGIALYRGDWLVAAILVLWWMISRTLKVLPHFRKYPSDIGIIPLHVAYTFFLAVVKIYTLLTVDEQTWITRWDKSRLNPLSFWQKTSAYAATLSIVYFLFFFTYETNNHVLSKPEMARMKAEAAYEKAQKKLLKTEDESQLLISDSRLAEERMNNLSEKIDEDAFGYYRIQPGDTVNTIRRRFLLRQDAPVLSGSDNTPLTTRSFMRAGNRVAIAVDDLRNPDVESYRSESKTGFGIMNYPKQNAIKIVGRGSFVTMGDLAKRVNNKSIIEDLGNKEFIIRRNIFVEDGVTLIIDGSDVTWLKLKSEPSRFVWLKSENGNIVINGTKITSWDETKQAYDTDWQDGRSYILQKLSGRMDILESELAYLGYYGSPNRGNPYGGPYGVSWKISNGLFRSQLSTGTISRSRIHDNLFGAYMYGATGVVLSDNDIFDNVVYGVDPHDDSNHLLIENNRVFRNGSHGIIISKRCFSNTIRGNISQNNRLHGIMLDRDSDNNLVEGNYVSGNENGIVTNHSSDNMIVYNSLSGNRLGARANNESHGNVFSENVIEDSQKGVYVYQRSIDNYVFRNQFAHNKLNVHLKQNSNALYTKAEDKNVQQEKKSLLRIIRTFF